jgi:glycerol kinase
MTDAALVVTVDQGSSGTKAQALGGNGRIVGHSFTAVAESHPQPGWVEQDPLEIWRSVQSAVGAALYGHDASQVARLALTNQRESLVLWERVSGEPVCPMISWQDRRSDGLAARIVSSGVADRVRRISGLPLDPMFSALKASWLLDTYDTDRARSRRGELCLGTVDSWLLSRFGGEHTIEIGNASRTQLLDLGTGQWSSELLDIFDVPIELLPQVVASDGPFPVVRGLGTIPDGVPVGAVLGDSHAAVYGHGIRSTGAVKATYGTGSSVMGLVDSRPLQDHGMCTTIAWSTQASGTPTYAIEGNIRASGATLTWLGRLLGRTPQELADLADRHVSEGVHLVPAFNGLGAPWWDVEATGVLTGLSLGAGPGQVARAALESIAFQVADVVAAAGRAGAPAARLLADGGASANETLMQLQADMVGVPVERTLSADLSALGVGRFAGTSAGIWDDAALDPLERDAFEPHWSDADRAIRTSAWHDALRRARGRN